MRIPSIHIILLALLVVVACDTDEEHNLKDGAVARAYDAYLYLDQISGLTPDMHPADSINIIHSAIDNWLIEQLAFQKAQVQLPEAQRREIDRKVSAYQRELYTFAYETEVLEQKMDQEISDSVLQAYYQEYISNYLLEEAYLRFVFVRCDKKNYVKEVEAWMTDSLDLYTLEDFCSEELQMCHLLPEEWVSLKKFTERLSDLNLDMNKVKQGGFIKVKENNVHYLIRILEFKDKGEPAPITFVQKDITSILLKNRRKEFLKSFHRQLISSETVKGNVKIYKNDNE